MNYYFSSFLLQSDRSIQVKTIEMARRDLVKGDCHHLAVIEVKITVLEGSNFWDFDIELLNRE